jgi:hypothetical protein
MRLDANHAKKPLKRAFLLLAIHSPYSTSQSPLKRIKIGFTAMFS